MAGSVRSVSVRLSAEVSGYIAGMRSAGKATKDALGDATKYASEHQKTLGKVGDVAGKVGLAAAAGLGAIVYASANFDQAMSNVQAATHETTENMDALREAALQAGADTAFSATEAAAGIEALSKAGVQTTEVLEGGLQGALDLAAAGGMEVADAAEAAAGAMAQFKLDGSQVPHIADLLAAAAGKAQGEVSDMVMALKQAGTVSAQTGLTLEETTGALAAMAEQSLLGSDAGTSFKTMLAALTPNSEKAASAMEQYNIHAFDARGNFVGMTELAGQLERGLGNLTDEQRASTLETIFGSDAVRAASIIYDNGADGIAKWIGQVDDAGYAAETAGIKLDNLAGDWERLMGSLETAAIGAGDGSQGPLRALVQDADGLVNKFNDLSPATQGLVTKLLAITAITGGAAWFGSKVLTGINTTRDALSELGVTGSRTGRILRTALAGAAVLEGLNLLDQGIDAVFDHDLDTSNLGRSLTALSSGNVSGEIERVFGGDLEGFSHAMERLTSNWTIHSRALNSLPVIGGFLAGDVGDDIENFKKLDEELAGLVESGQRDQAAQMFDVLAGKASEAGFSVGEVAEQFDEYQLALANANGLFTTGQAIMGSFTGAQQILAAALGQTGGSADGAAAGIDGLGGAADDAKRAVLSLDDAMSDLFKGLDADAATDAWHDSIQKLTGALEGGQGALNGLTKRGRENKAEIRDSIAALRARAEAQYEENDNAKQLERTLLRGRDAIIAQAKAANIGEKAMVGYLKELGFTPKEIRTAVELMGVPEAEAGINNVQVQLSALDRRIATATMRARDEASGVIAAIRNSMLSLQDKTIYIRSVHTTSRLNTPEERAAGGAIVGPGSGTSDDVPIMASNGEHIWTAAETAAAGGHAAMMRLRYLAKSGQLRGYATGGPISADRTATAAPSSSPYSPVSLAGLSVSGTLQTPWGPADIIGIVDDRIAAGVRHDRATGRR